MPANYTEDDLADGRAALLSGWSASSEPGLVITKTSGALAWDAKGNEYIDCTAMAWSNNIGGSNPEVIDAAFAQARELSHLRSNFDSVPLLLLAKAMTDAAPGDLKRIGFTLHGSLAVEMAMKLASCWPRCFPCTASSAGRAPPTWPRRPTTPDPSPRSP